MFVYDFVAFGVGAVVLGFGVVIDKLSCAHFEYFHGIEERSRPSESLKIEEALSVDKVVLVKILRGEFFVKL